jgi:plastocyanin
MAAHRRGPAAAALALVFAWVTIVGTAGSASAATVSVRGIFNGTRFVWTPKVREIVPGTSIRWRAVDGSHNVKSRGSNWTYFKSVPVGTSVTRTFNRRGTFKYYCTIHGNIVNGVCSGMCGRIVVS